MVTTKPVMIAIVAALFGALVPTLAVVKMMADNNNNGEVFDTVSGTWDAGYVLGISAIVYVPAFLLIFVIVFGIMHLWNRSADDI